MPKPDELRLHRRAFIKSAVISAAGLSSTNILAETRRLGPPASEQGTRSPHEQLKKHVHGQMLTHADTPIHQLHGTITPSDLHFERSHSGIPAISPDTYRLLIHGLVDRNLKFSLADLKRFPSCTRITFVECAGNCQDYLKKGPETTPQQLAGQTSQSEWTGVALSTLLRETGLKHKAKWLLAEGGDAALMTRSIPIEKAMDDAIICYAQNGEAVRPEQGYPVRLLLPGWEGSCCVKWLRRIEVGDQPWMTREETAKYTDPLPNGTARQFSFVMDARSVITSPAYPTQLRPGWHDIRSLAWSGRGSVKTVSISTDGGFHWQPATLHDPVLDKAHTRFSLPWYWDGKETVLLSRVIDDTGYRQPWAKEIIAARGAGSLRYHNNAIIGWRVKPDGCVYYEVVA